MPIRFRCVYCNQLLGISRRKAGTIVRCTSCEGQLIVPDPSDAPTEAGSREHPANQPANQAPKTENAGGGVFAADEFDAFLEPLNSGSGGPAVASPPAPSAKRSPAAALPPTVEPAPVAAITLTRLSLTIAIVAVVFGIGVSFAAGFWMGFVWR